MKLVMADPKLLKDTVSAVSTLLSEAGIVVKKDMLEIVSMDPANVAMVICRILSSSFVEYEPGNEKRIGVNLNNLLQVLKRAGANDMLEIAEEKNKLRISIKGKSTRHFHLPIIDIEDKPAKIPDLKFNGSIEMDSKAFSSVIDDAGVASESIMFSRFGETQLKISSEGDLSKVEVLIDPAQDDTVKFTTTGNIKSKFSLEYLQKMANGQKIADKVKIELAEDYPMKLHYTLMDKLQLMYILAPRVDSE